MGNARARTWATLGAMVVAQLLLSVTPASAACHIAGFSPSTVEVDEAAGEVTLTVVLQGRQPSCEGTVEFTTEDGTATAGEDYEAVSGTLSYSSGDDREETITVPILADDEDEGDEEFRVVLGATTGSISGTSDPATVTIVEAGGADGGDSGGTDGDPDPVDTSPEEEPTTPSVTATPTAADGAASDDDGLGGGVIALIVVGILLGAGALYAIVRRSGAA